MGLSSFASKPVEDVVAANPQTFFQMYWMGDRDTMSRRMARARDAGCVGLIATLDWSFSHGRDWGSPSIPDRIDLRTMVAFAPEVIRRPRWLLDFARSGRLPDLTTPNLQEPGEDAPTFFGAYGAWMGTPPPTWADVAWMREEWGGPFLLKGISRVDDALAARDAGVTAVSVSNHGGNNLDSTPAPIRMLPSIADAIGSDVEVLLDGGIRRGSDVVKAVALGAKAVLIGRAYLWGLAANGQAGVENVLDILRGGIDSALLGTGPLLDPRPDPRRHPRARRLHPHARSASLSDDRVALVTGAARGIGAATVRALAERGMCVVAVDGCLGDAHGLAGVDYPLATRADLETLASDTVSTLVADVRDPHAMKGAAQHAVDTFGRLDVGVAAAAVIAGGRPLWETPPAEPRHPLADRRARRLAHRDRRRTAPAERARPVPLPVRRRRLGRGQRGALPPRGVHHRQARGPRPGARAWPPT